MIRYISLLLLIGLAFWSCEEEKSSEDITPSSAIIGCWEVEVDDQWLFFLDNNTFNSVDDIGNAYRCEGPFDYTITDDKLTLYGESNDSIYVNIYNYYFSNDFNQITFTQIQFNNGEIESMNYSFGKRDDLEYAQFCD